MESKEGKLLRTLVKQVSNDSELKGRTSQRGFGVLVLNNLEDPMLYQDLNVLQYLRSKYGAALLVVVGMVHYEFNQSKEEVIKKTDTYYAKARDALKDTPDIYVSELVMYCYGLYQRILFDPLYKGIVEAINHYCVLDGTVEEISGRTDAHYFRADNRYSEVREYTNNGYFEYEEGTNDDLFKLVPQFASQKGD